MHQSELQHPGKKKARIKEPKIQVLGQDQIKKLCHALVALFPKEKWGLIFFSEKGPYGLVKDQTFPGFIDGTLP